MFMLCMTGTARVERVHAQGERALLVINTELREPGLDPQLRSLLQWIAASIAELPVLQLAHQNSKELQQVTFIFFLLHKYFLCIHQLSYLLTCEWERLSD